MDKDDIAEIELDLLLEAIYRRYGYDFRLYSRASIRRRVTSFMAQEKTAVISDLTRRLLHDEGYFQHLVGHFSVPVTEMFRDPEIYLAIRRKIVPYLHTYPFFKVWHAGCATGEEVYSLAILLQEEGLYERATIYATDLNEDALAKAQSGIYPLDRIRSYTVNYQKAGGKRSFAEYYHADDKFAKMSGNLVQNITFARHNLASDYVFSDMHLVMCRNVLIYFKKELQERALALFAESLIHDGFLVLGTKESLEFTAGGDKFTNFSEKDRIYRKKLAEPLASGGDNGYRQGQGG
jgi:chemotaxis protein methyltransferase CheR